MFITYIQFVIPSHFAEYNSAAKKYKIALAADKKLTDEQLALLNIPLIHTQVKANVALNERASQLVSELNISTVRSIALVLDFIPSYQVDFRESWTSTKYVNPRIYINANAGETVTSELERIRDGLLYLALRYEVV